MLATNDTHTFQVPGRRAGAAGTSSASTAAASGKQIVGKYELGKALAVGDFDCRTRLCTHIHTGDVYVVRIYSKAVLAEAEWMWARVRGSIHVQRTLPKHENIVEMCECFETRSSLYILMQLFPSTNLAALMHGEGRGRGLLGSVGSHPGRTRSTLSRTSGGTARSHSHHHHHHHHHRSQSRGAAEGAPSTKPQSRNQLTTGAASPISAASSSVNQVTPLPDFTFNTSKGQHHGHSHTRRGAGPRSFPRRRAPSSARGGGGHDDTSIAVIRAIFEQVVKGVLHMHQHGVVHTGIAPDHILVNINTNEVKISNLVSCCVCPRGQRLTELRGTRCTVAPEVLRKEPYDPYLVDAWSLGVLLYYMFNDGYYPHDGANTIKHILYNHVRPCRPSVPDDAKDLIARLLQPLPSERLTVEAVMLHPFLASIREARNNREHQQQQLQQQHSGGPSSPNGSTATDHEEGEAMEQLSPLFETVTRGAAAGGDLGRVRSFREALEERQTRAPSRLLTSSAVEADDNNNDDDDDGPGEDEDDSTDDDSSAMSGSTGAGTELPTGRRVGGGRPSAGNEFQTPLAIPPAALRGGCKRVSRGGGSSGAAPSTAGDGSDDERYSSSGGADDGAGAVCIENLAVVMGRNGSVFANASYFGDASVRTGASIVEERVNNNTNGGGTYSVAVASELAEKADDAAPSRANNSSGNSKAAGGGRQESVVLPSPQATTVLVRSSWDPATGTYRLQLPTHLSLEEQAAFVIQFWFREHRHRRLFTEETHRLRALAATMAAAAAAAAGGGSTDGAGNSHASSNAGGAADPRLVLPSSILIDHGDSSCVGVGGAAGASTVGGLLLSPSKTGSAASPRRTTAPLPILSFARRNSCSNSAVAANQQHNGNNNNNNNTSTSPWRCGGGSAAAAGNRVGAGVPVARNSVLTNAQRQQQQQQQQQQQRGSPLVSANTSTAAALPSITHTCGAVAAASSAPYASTTTTTTTPMGMGAGNAMECPVCHQSRIPRRNVTTAPYKSTRYTFTKGAYTIAEDKELSSTPAV